MSRNPTNVLRILAVLAAALLTAGPAVAGDDAALDEARAVISEKFGMIEPEDVKQSPIDGWYMIQKGSVIAYVTADALERWEVSFDVALKTAKANLARASGGGTCPNAPLNTSSWIRKSTGSTGPKRG